MAWCHQATSHHLSHCWPRSIPPHGIIRPQLVNKDLLYMTFCFVKYLNSIHMRWHALCNRDFTWDAFLMAGIYAFTIIFLLEAPYPIESPHKEKSDFSPFKHFSLPTRQNYKQAHHPNTQHLLLLLLGIIWYVRWHVVYNVDVSNCFLLLLIIPVIYG